MFKLLSLGRRNASGGGGVAQASHRIRSPMNKFRSWTSGTQHTPFQGDPGEHFHSFDSNSPRVDERS